MYTPPWIQAGQTKLEDVGEGIVAAAAKGAAINAQRMGLENQLSRLDMAIKEHEDLEKYRSAELGLRAKESDLRNISRQESLANRENSVGIREYDISQKWNEKHQAQDQYANIARGISDIDMNDPEAMNKLYALHAENPLGADTAAGRSTSTNFLRRYNSNASKQAQTLERDVRTWQNQTKKDMFSDYPGDWSVLMNEDQWSPQFATYDKDGKIEKYVGPDQGGTPTGDLYVPLKDPQSGAVTGYLTKPADLVKKKIKQYGEFQDRLDNLPRQESAPGYGVYPQPAVGQSQGVQSIPRGATADNLQEGVVYRTKKGPLRWNGSGFVPP